MELDMSREPASQPPPHVAISYSIFLPPPFLFLSISFTCFRFIFLNACSVNAGHRREKKREQSMPHGKARSMVGLTSKPR